MTNFDPKKLAEFLESNPDIGKAIAQSAPAPETPKEPEEKPYFASGDVLHVIEHGKELTYRIVRTTDGVVTARAYFASGESAGLRTVPQEELKELIKKEEEGPENSFPPIKDFVAKFGSNSGYHVNALSAWKRQWIDSGEIDAFRKAHGNVGLSDEQIEDAKKAIELYIEAIRVGAVTNIESAAKSIRISVGILTGVHDPSANDIEYWAKTKKLANGSYLDRLKEDIEKIKNPAPAAATPSVPPVGTPAPEPEKKEFVDVESAWPRFISFNQKTGWTITLNGKTEPLPTAEWEKASLNLKPIFDEYLKFMHEGNSKAHTAKRDMFRPLIDAKNRIVEALAAKDLDTASHEGEVVRALLEEAKEAWKTHAKEQEEKLRKEGEGAKKVAERKEKITADAFVAQHAEWLEQLKNKIEEFKAYGITSDEAAAFDRRMTRVLEKEASTKAYLERHHDGGKYEQDYDPSFIENFTQEIAELGAAVMYTEERIKKVSDKRPILRPIFGTEANKEQRIFLRDGRTMKVGEFAEEQKRVDMLAKHDQELETTRDEVATEELYRNAFALDPVKFLRVYTKERPAGEGRVYYTRNEKLLAHPHRKMIEQVLYENNIPLWEETGYEQEKDRMEAAEKAKGAPLSSLEQERKIYSPASGNKETDLLPKTEHEKKEYPASDRQDYEKDVDDKKPKMTEDHIKEQAANMTNRKNESAPMAKEADPEQPYEPLEKNKKFASVDAVLSSLSKGKNSWKAWVAIGLLGASAATYLAMKDLGKTPELPVSSAHAGEDIKMWTKYMPRLYMVKDPETKNFYEKEYKDAIVNLSEQDLLRKTAPSYFAGSNDPTKMSLSLQFLGDVMLNDKTGRYYGHLSDKARSQLSFLWLILQDNSMATSGQPLQAKTYKDAIMEIKQKVAKKEAEAGKK